MNGQGLSPSPRAAASGPHWPHATAKSRWALRVAGLGLILRLLHIQMLAHTPMFNYHRTFTESDMWAFDQWAHRIAQGDLLGRTTFHPVMRWQLEIAPPAKWHEWYGEEPTFYKSPLYAYLIAALQRLFGDAMLPLTLLQALASAASTYLLFLLGERLLGSNAGLLAACLHATYGPDIHYAATMLRGPFIVLLSLLATWLLWS